MWDTIKNKPVSTSKLLLFHSLLRGGKFMGVGVLQAAWALGSPARTLKAMGKAHKEGGFNSWKEVLSWKRMFGSATQE